MNLIDQLCILDPTRAWTVDERGIRAADDLRVPTLEELAALHAEHLDVWQEAQNAPQPKVWPDAEHFMAEFTFAELAAIALSQNGTIAALRMMLSTWLSTVRSDDARVILGLDALEQTGIIDADRRAVICGLTNA